MIDYHVDADGVAHIVWNNPDGPVNVKNTASMAAFVKAVDDAIADDAVKGVVIGSAKRDFLAGGDIDAVYAARTAEAAIANVRDVAACLRRMERCGKPFAAALNGSALGGGLEVALACHYRVCADGLRLRLGLPESTLGLIPGAGGTQRLPRLIGIGPATKLMLDGKAIGGAQALALGMVDTVVTAAAVTSTAVAWVLANREARQPWDRRDFRYRDFEPQSREGRWFFFHQWPRLRRRSPPAELGPGALLHVLAQGLQRDIDAGLAIEARYFGMVAASRSAKNTIRTRFTANGAARKLKNRPAGQPRFEPGRVGVIGAGLMGGGIALVCARAGLATVLVDTDEATARDGLARISRTLATAVERGFVSAEDRDATLERLRIGADLTALADCDVVIEAVVESAEVKSGLFRRLATIVGPQALIASNTSTLSITGLAQDVAMPERFVGLHFFAPVDRMQLVEIVLGEATSARTHAQALDLTRLLGKTAIVVRDGPGFFTSRVVAAYTREALTMLAEGVSPALVDNAAMLAGMPLGPLAMADLTSYALLVDILTSLAREGRGTARESTLAVQTARRLVAAGRPGRKGGGGVYDDDEHGRRVWPGLHALFPPLAEQPSLEDVTRRLLHVQSIEAVHAIDEGIIEDPLAIDLAAVLGWSYPGWRGGLLAHIDDTGLAAFVEECDRLAEQAGERFRCPESLRRRALAGTPFHAH